MSTKHMCVFRLYVHYLMAFLMAMFCPTSYASNFLLRLNVYQCNFNMLKLSIDSQHNSYSMSWRAFTVKYLCVNDELKSAGEMQWLLKQSQLSIYCHTVSQTRTSPVSLLLLLNLICLHPGRTRIL